MKIVETQVTYFEKDDLVKFAQDLPIEEIEYTHVKHHEILLKSNVVILKLKGKYRVLKSRY
jgi:hypothetical protein